MSTKKKTKKKQPGLDAQLRAQPEVKEALAGYSPDMWPVLLAVLRSFFEANELARVTPRSARASIYFASMMHDLHKEYPEAISIPTREQAKVFWEASKHSDQVSVLTHTAPDGRLLNVQIVAA